MTQADERAAVWLTQAKYDAQVKVLEARGAKSPTPKSGR